MYVSFRRLLVPLLLLLVGLASGPAMGQSGEGFFTCCQNTHSQVNWAHYQQYAEGLQLRGIVRSEYDDKKYAIILTGDWTVPGPMIVLDGHTERELFRSPDDMYPVMATMKNGNGYLVTNTSVGELLLLSPETGEVIDSLNTYWDGSSVSRYYPLQNGRVLIRVRENLYVIAALGRPNTIYHVLRFTISGEFSVHDEPFDLLRSEDERFLALASDTAAIVWDTSVAASSPILTVQLGEDVVPAAISSDGNLRLSDGQVIPPFEKAVTALPDTFWFINAYLTLVDQPTKEFIVAPGADTKRLKPSFSFSGTDGFASYSGVTEQEFFPRKVHYYEQRDHSMILEEVTPRGAVRLSMTAGSGVFEYENEDDRGGRVLAVKSHHLSCSKALVEIQHSSGVTFSMALLADLSQPQPLILRETSQSDYPATSFAEDVFTFSGSVPLEFNQNYTRRVQLKFDTYCSSLMGSERSH